MKQIHSYVVDFTRMNKNGDFSCPRCGTTISPDDCTEKAYFVQGTKVNHFGLEEVIVCCNMCQSQIHLTGFPLLQKLEEKDTKKKKNEEAPWYIAHI